MHALPVAHSDADKTYSPVSNTRVSNTNLSNTELSNTELSNTELSNAKGAEPEPLTSSFSNTVSEDSENIQTQARTDFLGEMSALSALIQSRLKLSQGDRFHESFMELASAVSESDHWQMQECYKFASRFLNLRKSCGPNQIFANDLLDKLAVFQKSLGDYSQDSSQKPDLSYIPEIALYCGDSRIFQSCLDAHISLSNNEAMNELQVAVRCLVRSGMQSSESVLSILKELNDLSQTEKFKSLSQNPELTLFFRGLILNSWTIAGSLILLRSAISLSQEPEKIIFLAAQNSIKARPSTGVSYYDVTESFSPSVLSFLSLGNTNKAELELITSFLYRHTEDPEKFDQTTRKICCLIEASRYSSCIDFEVLSGRVQRQIWKGQDLDSLISILLDNTVRSVDNKSARVLIEKVINADCSEEFKSNLEILRSLHNADVPTEIKIRGQTEADMYARQVRIFKDAISCFDLFQQVRLSIPLLSAELKRMPNGDASLLSCFAYEVSKVSNLYASESSYPGSGIEFYDFEISALFDLDPECPQDPLHRYYQIQGWSRQAVTDFLNSRIIILDSMIVFSLRSEDSLKFNGHDMCLVFYADSNQNYGSDQCLLLPVSLIDSCLQSSRYDFMELPDEKSSLVNLSEQGLRSEDLRLEAYKHDLPIFDIGAATNIGGLSNSTGDFKAEPHNRFHLDRIFGLDSVDPWGNVKKMHLLQFPELFNAHTNLHESLTAVFLRFAQAYKIFENRYSAWKKGATPVLENTDREWFGSLSANVHNYRMLQLAYKWHFHISNNPDSQLSARICFYRQGKVQDGPLQNFSLDIPTLKLESAGETFQLPVPDKISHKANPDHAIERYLLRSGAANIWDIYVRPNMAGNLPFLQFY